MTYRALLPALTLFAVIGGPLWAQRAPSPAESGEALFRQRCVMCHSNVAGRVTPMGPNLVGVVGRKAGSTGFAYSPGMKNLGIAWSAQSLDRYLQGPAAMVRGSKMPVGVPDPAQRAALIAYLTTLK